VAVLVRVEEAVLVAVAGGGKVWVALAGGMVKVGEGGGAKPVGTGVHQNQPAASVATLRSSATGSCPVSRSISSRMAGSTALNARNCQGR
jgi:hypothetical protein